MFLPISLGFRLRGATGINSAWNPDTALLVGRNEGNLTKFSADITHPCPCNLYDLAASCSHCLWSACRGSIFTSMLVHARCHYGTVVLNLLVYAYRYGVFFFSHEPIGQKPFFILLLIKNDIFMLFHTYGEAFVIKA